MNLREPIEWAQREAASDRYSWPVLILAAVALAVLAEAAFIVKVHPDLHFCGIMSPSREDAADPSSALRWRCSQMRHLS